MTDSQILKDTIEKSGLKKGQIAKVMGINPYTLALKINNEREFKASEIDALCRLLNINVDQRMAIFFAQ